MVEHASPLHMPKPKPRVRLIETRLLDAFETTAIWKRWDEEHQVIGLFDTCPLPKAPQLVVQRVHDGKEMRMHLSPYEISQKRDDGSVKIVGWCYAPSWDHLRRYAQDVHGIELPEQQTDPDNG